MKKNVKNDELQSRREFFKRAAKGTLPIIGVIAFGPGFLSSCGGGDDEGPGDGGYAPPTPNGDGSWMSPYSPSEAFRKAQTLSEGQTTDLVWIKGRVSSILYNYSVEEGTATFLIKDIGIDSVELRVYRAYYLGNSPYTSGSLLSIGDEVLINGKLTIYNGIPEVASRSGYIYSINGVTNPSEYCTDCSAACASNCSTECASSCASGCGTTCTGTCSGGCSTTCTGTCDASCTGGCKGTATGQCNTCSKSCMQYCGSGCKNSCSGNCDTTCDNSCGGMCESNCSHVGYGSYSCTICSGTCSRACGTTCAYNCSGTCTSTCKGTSS